MTTTRRFVRILIPGLYVHIDCVSCISLVRYYATLIDQLQPAGSHLHSSTYIATSTLYSYENIIKYPFCSIVKCQRM